MPEVRGEDVPPLKADFCAGVESCAGGGGGGVEEVVGDYMHNFWDLCDCCHCFGELGGVVYEGQERAGEKVV